MDLQKPGGFVMINYQLEHVRNRHLNIEGLSGVKEIAEIA